MTVASLLVSFSGQFLYWQEPTSAMVETIHRLLQFCKRPRKSFSTFGNTLYRS